MKSIRLIPYLLCATAPALHANTITASGDVTPSPVPPAYWRIDGTNLVVGNTATGSLSMTDGGEVYVDNAGATIGFASGVTGTITVDGAGSTFEISQSFTVGESGHGQFTVSGKGIATSRGSSALGYNSGSLGEATVSGAGSIWNSGGLTVGSSGEGKLTISSGGSVTSGLTSIGSNAGSSGEVTVTGANSVWESSSLLFLGGQGTGKLAILDGGKVVRTSVRLGQNEGGSGELVVSGANSILEANSVTVGAAGEGTATIANGGTLSVGTVTIASSGTGSLNIGDYDTPSTAGTLDATTVDMDSNGAAVYFNQTDATTFGAQLTGSGNVIQRGSGSTTLTGANDYTGPTTVEAGTLVVNGTISDSELTVKDGGTLAGTGTLSDVILEGGARLSPGNSIGTLNAKSLTWEKGAVLVFELGATTNDKIVLTEGLWRGSSMDDYSFEFINAGWQVGHTYTLATFDRSDFGADDFHFTNTGEFEGEFEMNGQELRFTVYSVPEPSTWAMLIVSGVAIGLRRRRY